MKKRTSNSLPVVVCLSFILHISSFILSVHGSSGASFLKIPVGARAVGMGSAYTAMANDVSAIYWNPAGLSGIEKKEVGFMHSELFAGVRHEFMGFTMPIQSANRSMRRTWSYQSLPDGQKERIGNWSMGIGAIYVSQNKIEGRDENRQIAGSFSANDVALTLGASRIVTKRTSIGMNIKVLRQSIESENASGWALDFGLLTKTPKLNLGLSLQNIGPSIKFITQSSALPLTFSAGLGYRFWNPLMLCFNLSHKPTDHKTTVGLGSEVSLMKYFSLRWGYSDSFAYYQPGKEGNSPLERFSGLSGGFGINLSIVQIDYALTPMGDLGNGQRIGMTFQF